MDENELKSNIREASIHLIKGAKATCQSALSILENMDNDGPPYTLEDVRILNEAFNILQRCIQNLLSAGGKDLQEG